VFALLDGVAKHFESHCQVCVSPSTPLRGVGLKFQIVEFWGLNQKQWVQIGFSFKCVLFWLWMCSDYRVKNK